MNAPLSQGGAFVIPEGELSLYDPLGSHRAALEAQRRYEEIRRSIAPTLGLSAALERQLQEFRGRTYALSNLAGPADYSRHLQSMLAGYSAVQSAALGVDRLMSESNRWRTLIDQVSQQRKLDDIRRSTLMSSWATWQASTEMLAQVLPLYAQPRLVAERLFWPIEQYSRYARQAGRQLVDASDDVEEASVTGSLTLAEEQVESNTALVVEAIAEGDLKASVGEGMTSGDANLAAPPRSLAIELPTHAVVFYVQQRELKGHGLEVLTASSSELIRLSPAARLSQRIRSVGNLLLECNRAAKFAGQEEVFKPTTTWAGSLHSMNYIAVSDRDSLATFVDCLFHLLYEGAGDDNLRFLRYVERSDCDAIWAIKQLRNKTFRHDPDHGKEKKIDKSWEDLKASQEAIGISSWPASAADYSVMQERLVEATYAFLMLLLTRIQAIS